MIIQLGMTDGLGSRQGISVERDRTEDARVRDALPTFAHVETQQAHDQADRPTGPDRSYAPVWIAGSAALGYLLAAAAWYYA